MHILLEKAKTYTIHENLLTPKGFFYDFEKGFWRNNRDGSAYITSDKAIRPACKKEDIETGEDQKGE